MTLTDVIILVSVIFILFSIIYFSFIKKGKIKGSCKYCPSANGKKKNRLIKDFNKKYNKEQNQNSL